MLLLTLSGLDPLNEFVQQCIFPRVLFSQADALFCSNFVVHLHELKTPSFRCHPPSPSNVTRGYPPSLLMLQGIALLPF